MFAIKGNKDIIKRIVHLSIDQAQVSKLSFLKEENI